MLFITYRYNTRNSLACSLSSTSLPSGGLSLPAVCCMRRGHVASGLCRHRAICVLADGILQAGRRGGHSAVPAQRFSAPAWDAALQGVGGVRPGLNGSRCVLCTFVPLMAYTFFYTKIKTEIFLLMIDFL